MSVLYIQVVDWMLLLLGRSDLSASTLLKEQQLKQFKHKI